MKQHTKEEIEKKIAEIWDDEFFYSWKGEKVAVVEPPEIKIEMRDKKVFITIHKMYEYPNLSFSKLKALSDFFETENITDPDRYSYGGCETCDYGSDYGFTLEVF